MLLSKWAAQAQVEPRQEGWEVVWVVGWGEVRAAPVCPGSDHGEEEGGRDLERLKGISEEV